MKKKQLPLNAPQSQFNCGAYPIVQISSLKLPMTLHAYRLEEETFGTKMATYGKFQSTYNSKSLKKTSSIVNLLPYSRKLTF